eukprot:gb/GEZN01010773.1/.p1 GENE.gb/GEZN01010773.1/~~gb/GEZN01010773.1/.p1  ORF type:complete len:306 (-),score=26.15 gb/GEZN01010773.1/:296-1189(-)
MSVKRGIIRSVGFVAEIVSRIADLVVQAIGPVLTVLALFLIASVTYQFFLTVLPVLMVTYGTVQAELIALVGVWILFNLLYNYFMTQKLGPGFAPSSIPQEKMAMLAEDPETPDGQPYRFCRKCNVVKPMRAHHCSVCRRCVLKMDHHCPWVNTCVGWRNHKHFLLFLFHLNIGSLFYLVFSFPMAFGNLGRISNSYFVVTSVISLSAFLATGMFLLWNLFLLLSNQSTIECFGNFFNKDGRGNPYHLGIRRNITEVFGSGNLLWKIFVPSNSPPVGDGVLYEMRDRNIFRSAGVQI